MVLSLSTEYLLNMWRVTERQSHTFSPSRRTKDKGKGVNVDFKICGILKPFIAYCIHVIGLVNRGVRFKSSK